VHAHPPFETAATVLVVVGSASEQSRLQLQALVKDGVPVVTLQARALTGGTARGKALRDALEHGPAAVTVGATSAGPATPRELASALALLVAQVRPHIPLVLIGGDTARAVLDALGVRWIEPIAELEHGAVLSRTSGDRLIVTRPGSFGAPESLRIILERFTHHLAGATPAPGPH
jgi:4-hydroxythreonine-4-phosphate dehydrogenase